MGTDDLNEPVSLKSELLLSPSYSAARTLDTADLIACSSCLSISPLFIKLDAVVIGGYMTTGDHDASCVILQCVVGKGWRGYEAAVYSHMSFSVIAAMTL